ncbi:polysaccharide biosynthesis/export family protein [Candidatus Laterigemmans baculatus]|uniref:polysaccharide biosynthesis/export family protein n=1 Tax=Candidatus Laterigemmans baculatus TaxID=2770505 RepID=UPI001F35A455|nr:SLBB domain-containing protein [Candidatus Laterigemmans baculatus]
MIRTCFSIGRWLASALLVVAVAGCSTSGGTFSLVPTGHYLTEQTEAVLDASPRVAALPRELDKTVLPAMFLQPGDMLLVEPVDFASEVRLPADQEVLPDGTIDLAGYGRVIVAGLTIEQAEQLVETTLHDAGEEGEQVNIRMVEPQLVYYVLGEVSSPGAYPLTGNETVLDGILAAGGLTSRASPCDILLARPTPPPSCRVTLPICYRQITQLGDTSTNYQLQPGDRIFVGSRTLCEDLAFWRTRETCERCDCRAQYPCSNPCVAQPGNPFSVLPAQPYPATEFPGAPSILSQPEGAESAPLPPGVPAPPAVETEDGEVYPSVQAPQVPRRPIEPPVAATGLIE